MNNVCPGCQRDEVHKKCPAHGTPYYMSGVLFTKSMEMEQKKRRCISGKEYSILMNTDHKTYTVNVPDIKRNGFVYYEHEISGDILVVGRAVLDSDEDGFVLIQKLI